MGLNILLVCFQCGQAAEGGVKEATLVALEGVMTHAGKSVSAPVNARLLSSLQGMLSSEEDVVRTSAAKTLGIVSQVSYFLMLVTSFVLPVLAKF